MKKSFNVQETFNNMRIDRWIRNNLGNIPQGLIEKNLRNGKVYRVWIWNRIYILRKCEDLRMKKERKLAVSGQFYPSDVKELEKYIQHFNSVLEQYDIKADILI